mmetsp:Transcript_7428/g.23341  ORF Transcript_7428/g.23341 Transcript_7428/m.23341 type:complete len:179 (-) Transcript_7428:287-823(-)
MVRPLTALALAVATAAPGGWPLCTSATLCIDEQPQLEHLVLKVRQHLVGPVLNGEQHGLASTETLEGMRRYSPKVRDESLCHSADGPYCAFTGVFGPAPPVIADGALFHSKAFALSVEPEKELEEPKGEGVSCGGHRAESCFACPQGNGAVWCNGDCTWVEGECVRRTPPQTPDDAEP